MGKNLFLNFEGVDGTGKTTMAQGIAAKYGFKYLRTPDSHSPLTKLRAYIETLDYETRFNYYNLCSRTIHSKLKDALVEGGVCLDRYYPSTLAMHNVLLGRDLFSEMIKDGLIEPDAIILLVASEKDIRERLKERAKKDGQTPNDALIQRGDLIIKVQDEYLRLFGRNSNTFIFSTSSNANSVYQTAEQVSRMIDNVIMKR